MRISHYSTVRTESNRIINGPEVGERARRELGGLKTVFAVAALSAAVAAHAQTATAPAPVADDSLTWHGVTLYGTIDVGLQYESHGAPFSDYYTPASTNIVQKDSRESVFGATGSNFSQSKVGLRGLEPIVGDWSGVFAVETWFNPQAGRANDQ
jgi:predicted porin